MSRLLASEAAFWVIASTIFGEIAVLKGMRYPNEWAATQAQIDYSQGFSKRALFGATLGHALGLHHFNRFAVVSEFLLLLCFALVAVFVWRSGLMARLGSGVAVAAFFASYATTFLAHIVGYLEIPLACLTMAVLLVRDPRLRFAVALPATVVALLTHEMFLVVFLPLLLLSFILGTTDAERRRGMVYSGTIAVVAVTAFLALALRAPLGPSAVERLYNHVAARTDFRPAVDVFRVYLLSLHDNFRGMQGYFASPAWWHDQLLSAVVFLPTTAAFVWCAWWMLSAAQHPHRRLILAAVVACALAPLLMHLIGWDVGRWNALTVFDSFLALLTVCYFTEAQPAPLPIAARNAMMLLIGLSLASGGLLMDHAQARLYPFF